MNVELSIRSENALKMLSVSAVDSGAGVGSTASNRLRPSDVSAALGMIADVKWRTALEVKAGLADEADVRDLLILIRKNLDGFAWYSRADMQSSRYRVKLDRVSRCAISRLAGYPPGQKEMAECLGMSRQGFRKTWSDREKEIYQMVLQWSIEGDMALKRALSGRFDSI